MVSATIMPASHTNNNEQALHSAALELKYAQSIHLVDSITRDEESRRFRVQIHVLQDDNDELRQLLQEEEQRSDNFEKLVNEELARAEEAEAQLVDLETDLRQREQEIQALAAEKNALQHSSADATAALTEKLALTRELSLLKPELEHLKQQAASTESLLTEKLALQRQVTNIQCELENAKREAQRALAKRRNTGVEIAQEVQMEELKRQLAKEKRARQRAEETAETASGDVQVDDVRKQLAKERKARQRAEEALEAAQEATQVEDMRKDLLKEKKAKAKLEEALETAQAELEREQKAAARAAKRADGNAQAGDEAEELRAELAKEKKERGKMEKLVQQASAEFEAQKTTLEEKIVQFRNKLRTTKEQLKTTEAELAAARENAASVTATKKATASKSNPKKRNATQMDPDATTLGTPGDGPAAKKSRKAGTGVGDKSTFSITPFLNRTTSVIQDEEDNDEDADASPAASKARPQPLAQQPASSANIPLKKTAKSKPKPALEMVTEEKEPDEIHQQGQENATTTKAPGAKGKTTQALKIKTKTTDGPTNDDPTQKQKSKPKMRKSLADFASFNLDPGVEKKQQQQQKKRKLGGLGKTLFDEEEEASAPTKGFAAGARGLFGMKGFGAGKKKSGALGMGSSFLGSSRATNTTAMGASGGASVVLTAGDGSGFQFSPLKKARRNLDDTLRG